MKMLVFGCGYLGARVARRWIDAGNDAVVVTRSEPRAAELRRAGMSPIVADVTNRESLSSLPAVDVVLFAVGFDRASGHGIRDVYVTGLANVLDALQQAAAKDLPVGWTPRPSELSNQIRTDEASILRRGTSPDAAALGTRFIYISSTGVYGHVAGDWVDESSPCQPTREGGQACLDAENLLRASPLASRTVILRLAGIYGPGRIPMRDAIVKGEPLPVPAEGFVNLIHVEDAATITLAVAAASPPSPLYVVSDGQPVQRGDYYAYMAQLLNAPAPRFTTPDAASHVTRRAGSDKRISNARLMNELKPTLRFPSYREGLADIV